MLTFNFCHPKQFSRAFIADLKEELEKEKESQNAIRKRIEEETKTTGKDIWVVLPRTGKMSNICHNFFFFWSFTVAKRFDFLKFRQLFWRDFVR